MTAAPDTGEHEWSRLLPGWHLAFAALAGVTVLLVLLDDALTGRVRAVAVLLVLLLAGCYARLGAPALQAGHTGASTGASAPAGAVRYLALALPLVAVLFAFAPAGALLLFALYPQVWMLLPVRRAVLATVLLDAAVTAVALVRADGRQDQVGWLVVGGISLLVALLLGTWITRVVEQSRRRAVLIAELDRTRQELAVLSRQAGVAAERERMAAEIHDTVAQGFTGVLILLEAVESRLGTDPEGAAHLLQQARLTARENLAEARALVAGLTPPDLAETSLPEALRRLVDRAWPDAASPVRLAVEGEPRTLPVEQEVTALRTAQEALTNARRHAGASSVQVLLRYSADETVLQVRDDGRGFDPSAAPDPAPGNGFGLAAMRSRAEQAGGLLAVEAAPQAGVTVRLVLPAGAR